MTPVHSQVLRLPSSSKVAAAKRFAEEQASLARSAEQAAEQHLQRAEVAARQVKKASDVRSAEEQAKAEAGLATEAEHNATVGQNKHLMWRVRRSRSWKRRSLKTRPFELSSKQKKLLRSGSWRCRYAEARWAFGFTKRCSDLLGHDIEVHGF